MPDSGTFIYNGIWWSRRLVSRILRDLTPSVLVVHAMDLLLPHLGAVPTTDVVSFRDLLQATAQQQVVGRSDVWCYQYTGGACL